MKNNEQIQPKILEKYTIIKKLGSGAYGHVWKAKSKATNSIVALKKIFDAFQHSVDAQRTFRQISILRQLNHSKIIKLEQVLSAKNNQDIYLIFQYMQSDLYHLLYESKLQPIHTKYITYQIVLGIHYLHSNKLIHRDLKPSNILVNSDCSAKICDFGLVRFLGTDMLNFNTLTEGVATRWYRAPQVLLGSNSYDTQADMWSLGCILGEIVLKSPLFPGNSTTNQLQKILQVVAQPTTADIKSINAELAEVMVTQICSTKSKKKVDVFHKAQDKLLVDLIYKLIEFNPGKRLTAEETLKHPYFQDFYNPLDLQVKVQNIKMEIDENVRLETHQYLNIISEKFITKEKERNQSDSKNKRCIGESPKSFSDLKKSRVSSVCKSPTSSSSRVKGPLEETQVGTNLFKELCSEKSAKKGQNRSFSKQNIASNQNFDKKQQEKTKKNSFQTFAAVKNLAGTTSQLKKYGDENKIGGFSGLRKISKVMQK